jgi:hypothetical protein
LLAVAVHVLALTEGGCLLTWLAAVHLLGLLQDAAALGGHQLMLQDLKSQFPLEFV